ncbi:hypothetical protein ACP4OV_013543 [Aristida adscensionis]
MALPVRRPRPKYAAALLSPSCLHTLPSRASSRRGSAAATALLVGPFGKVWHVELRRRASGGGGGGGGEAWQLGRGWAEFAAAHGAGAGWSFVFVLERRGVATVRAFDADGCLARLCALHAGVEVGKNRPRFIRLLDRMDLEKMKIPDKFVHEHLTEGCPISKNAMIFSPLGKFWHVELDRDQPGVLLGDGWVRFLTAHDLSEGNILVFRYEGNMVFTVEVFLHNGCLKQYEAAVASLIDDADGASTEPQRGLGQPVVSPIRKKRKNRNEIVFMEAFHKTQKVSPISAKKVIRQKKLVSMVPRHSFTKQITSYDLNSFLAVKGTFCSSVGLGGASEIVHGQHKILVRIFQHGQHLWLHNGTWLEKLLS